jgi:hypothetical protein
MDFFCNGHILPSVTKNACNGHLTSPLPEVLNSNGRCGGVVGVEPIALMANRRQTTNVVVVDVCNGF